MLVSVNAEEGTVTIYGSSIITLPLLQYQKLRGLIGRKTVQYVTECVETTGDDIIDLIENLLSSPEVLAAAQQAALTGDGRLWLHATGSGFIPHIPKMKLRFEGPDDFKSMDKLGLDVAEKFPQIQALLDSKKLEIVTTGQMENTKRSNASKQAERDKHLDSMIVDLSIGQKFTKGMDKSAMSTILSGRGGAGGREDVEEIEAGGEAPLTSENAELVKEMGLGKAEETKETEE